jgi:predicted aldo/keto reductase-like oxidoreductase
MGCALGTRVRPHRLSADYRRVMKRRAFLQDAAVAAAMLTCFPAGLAGVERQKPRGKIERRALGRTGRKLSIIGFGGLVLKNSSPAEAAELVREAFEAGVNYFDVAPTYGNSEERLGPALEPYRRQVFLACKTTRRKRAEAAAELDRSLSRLRTDHFDLYQLHAVTTVEDVETILGPGGAMEAFEEAKRAGKIRHIGFSAHSVEAALALMARHDFDTILFPVNYATWHAGNFGPQVLETARKRKMGILALKAMAKRPWPKGADRSAFPNCWYEPMTDPEEALMGLRFTLSHPVTAAVTPANPVCLRLALDLASKIKPLKKAEVASIKEKALGVAPLFRYPREQRAAADAADHYFTV